MNSIKVYRYPDGERVIVVIDDFWCLYVGETYIDDPPYRDLENWERFGEKDAIALTEGVWGKPVYEWSST
jgi:hypothetical protein